MEVYILQLNLLFEGKTCLCGPYPLDLGKDVFPAKSSVLRVHCSYLGNLVAKQLKRMDTYQRQCENISASWDLYFSRCAAN